MVRAFFDKLQISVRFEERAPEFKVKEIYR
jgi:hypothetical protein